MQEKPVATFQEAIDAVESLPQNQQEDLINILRCRILEQKRNLLQRASKKPDLSIKEETLKEVQ